MRGSTSTSVTDTECVLSDHLISVTDRAQAEADRRNQSWTDDLDHYRTSNPQLYAMMRMLERPPTTARDVICEWTRKDASICTRCHQTIATDEPVMLDRRSDGILVVRHPDILHLRCADYWRSCRSVYCGNCSRVMFTYGVGPRRYCCDNCRESATAKRRQDVAHDRTCQHCDQPFTGRADARYCSTRCRVAAHRAKRCPRKSSAPGAVDSLPARPLRDSSATSATSATQPAPGSDPAHPQHPQHRNTDGQP